jgi:arylsulfatase
MATCVDVGGAKYPVEFNGHPITAMEGRSLQPAFRSETISREAIYWEHDGNRAIRVGTWKLVAKFPAGKWELYDMSRDRTEMNDLAGAEPDRVKAMSEQWDAWANRAHALPWPWKKPVYGE